MDFLVKIFKAVASEHRVRLLNHLLSNGERPLEAIAQALSLPYKTAARNLKILEMANLVKSRRWQGTVLYDISRDRALEYNSMIYSILKKRKGGG